MICTYVVTTFLVEDVALDDLSKALYATKYVHILYFTAVIKLYIYKIINQHRSLSLTASW